MCSRQISPCSSFVHHGRYSPHFVTEPPECIPCCPPNHVPSNQQHCRFVCIPRGCHSPPRSCDEPVSRLPPFFSNDRIINVCSDRNISPKQCHHHSPRKSSVIKESTFLVMGAYQPKRSKEVSKSRLSGRTKSIAMGRARTKPLSDIEGQTDGIAPIEAEHVTITHTLSLEMSDGFQLDMRVSESVHSESNTVSIKVVMPIPVVVDGESSNIKVATTSAQTTNGKTTGSMGTYVTVRERSRGSRSNRGNRHNDGSSNRDHGSGGNRDNGAEGNRDYADVGSGGSPDLRGSKNIGKKVIKKGKQVKNHSRSNNMFQSNKYIGNGYADDLSQCNTKKNLTNAIINRGGTECLLIPKKLIERLKNCERIERKGYAAEGKYEPDMGNECMNKKLRDVNLVLNYPRYKGDTSRICAPLRKMDHCLYNSNIPKKIYFDDLKVSSYFAKCPISLNVLADRIPVCNSKVNCKQKSEWKFDSNLFKRSNSPCSSQSQSSSMIPNVVVNPNYPLPISYNCQQIF